MDKRSLRPVRVSIGDTKTRGYFHRYIYNSHNFYTETHMLIEHEDGKLRMYEPYFVQFMDRKDKEETKKNVPK